MKAPIVVTATLLLVALTGCASNYEMYLQTMHDIEMQRASADIARAEAIRDVGASGDDTAKVAAMFALQSAGNGSGQSVALTAPRSVGDRVFDVFLGAMPFVVQGYVAHENSRTTMASVASNRDMHVSTMGAFSEMAGMIQAPQANNSSAVATTTTTVNRTVHETAISDSYNPVTETTTTDSTHVPATLPVIP